MTVNIPKITVSDALGLPPLPSLAPIPNVVQTPAEIARENIRSGTADFKTQLLAAAGTDEAQVAEATSLINDIESSESDLDTTAAIADATLGAEAAAVTLCAGQFLSASGIMDSDLVGSLAESKNAILDKLSGTANSVFGPLEDKILEIRDAIRETSTYQYLAQLARELRDTFVSVGQAIADTLSSLSDIKDLVSEAATAFTTVAANVLNSDLMDLCGGPAVLLQKHNKVAAQTKAAMSNAKAAGLQGAEAAKAAGDSVASALGFHDRAAALLG